jgi:bifunctional DNase/RNase
VVLKDETGQITLPIWIGIAEATSIASAIKQVTMARPLTHDLMYDLLLDLGVTVQRVVITELKDSTYFAELVLGQGDRALILDSRPSDAIALALRAAAPIYVAQKVLEQAKVVFESSSQGGAPRADGAGPNTAEPGAQEGEAAEAEAPQDSQDFTAIDKDKWEEILKQLDPDDFKYKM